MPPDDTKSAQAVFPRTVSLQPTLPPPLYPHKRRRRWVPFLQSCGTGLLFLLILICLLASLVDFGIQFVQSNRSSKVADLATTFGTYVGVVVMAVILIITRSVANRQAMISIPKGYLPTKSTDKAHELIQNEYERACIITKVSQPKGRNQAGWGRPGTPFEDVYFRGSILSTIATLRAALLPLFPFLSEMPVSRASPLSPLAPLLSLDPSPIPEALLPLADLYEQQLVKAKYGKEEPTAEDWDAVVKVVAVFVGVLQQLGAAGPSEEAGQQDGGFPSSRA
ncbi:hypothetical protein JCM6882_003619 [Rhodosporidiobolus microsporus]